MTTDQGYDEGEGASEAIAAPELTGEAVLDIAALAAYQLALEARVAEKEDELKKAKEALKGVAERDLPNAVLATGVAEILLADGSKVKVNTSYSAGITEKNRDAAFAWLREHEHGHIIKRELAIYFGVGEDELADKILGLMKENAPQNETAAGESVHAGTLKKFVREKIAAEDALKAENPDAIINDALPRDMFSVYIANVAKIVPPSKSKAETIAAKKRQDADEQF